MGRALRDFAKRGDVVVATKFLPRTQEEIEQGISGQQHIENMINTSLQNLGMDYVDLYIYHMWDWQTPLKDIMDGLNRIVKAGKARYIGISNCFAWQIAKANALAEKEGFAKSVSIQGHYYLIFRGEEREMVPYCNEENIALTPYSALASGRLSRPPGEAGTKRAVEDAYAKFKYDATAAQDSVIISRVAELAKKHSVTMTEVSLAWLLTKVTSPVTFARQMHLSLSHWAFVLMGLHLGLHIPAIAAGLKLKDKTKIVLVCVFACIAGIGLWLFLRNGMTNYLFFRVPFAFLDYEKTGWLVFLENLLMLSFWVFIGTQTALICRNRGVCKK